MMDKSKKMESLLVMMTGFIVLYLIFHAKAYILIALTIGLITILSDYLSDKIYWLWMKLAHILGVINSKILLSLIFFLILTPIAFLFKLIGKSNLNLKKDTSSTSYYSSRNYEYKKEDLENIF